MSLSTDRRTSPRAARLVALVLACAFLLQSAAQAGQGCLARVFSGVCCCAVVETAADAVENDVAPATEGHSCCAPSAPASTDESRVESPNECDCDSVSAPTAPVAPQTPDAATARSVERILHAQPVASPACAAAAAWERVEQRALERPPEPHRTFDASFARTRLAQRGVSGFLSELCTLRR